MNENIVSLLREKQERLSRRYNELENLQGKLPHAYGIIQNGMQRIDNISECYRTVIYNLEMAIRLESEVA